VSFFDPLSGGSLLVLEGFGIAQGTLVEEFLYGTPVVKTALELWDEVVGDIDGEAASFDSSVKDMTGVLLAAMTDFTVLANTRASPQAQGAEHSGPQAGGLFSKPLLDIGERVHFRGHGACVPYNTHACQEKTQTTKKINFLNFTMSYEFCDRN
jgi:hypothetical protein